MIEEQLLCARAQLCKFSVHVIFFLVKCSPCSSAWLWTDARSSNITGQFTTKICSSLAISLYMDFSQRVYKSCCHLVAVMILLMHVNNNGIRHNCEELVQVFEKFVVMAMNPGADLDS